MQPLARKDMDPEIRAAHDGRRALREGANNEILSAGDIGVLRSLLTEMEGLAHRLNTLERKMRMIDPENK